MVRLKVTWRRIKPVFRGLGISLMLGLWLATVAFAASPDLHSRLHQDAGNHSHECLITLMFQGHLPVFFSETMTIVVPWCIGVLMPVACFRHLPLGDLRLLPSRAPPSLSLR